MNRVVVQQGFGPDDDLLLVRKHGARTASGLMAKLQLMVGRVTKGCNESAIVRLIIPIDPDELLIFTQK